MILRASLAAGCVLGCIFLPSAHAQRPVPYRTLQHLEPGDSAAEIVAKAAHVLPRANQTAWMRLERTFFVHYGPNAFRHVEWGTGREDPSIFNPSALDADQWVRSVKEGGGTMIILVCKHHDGFALWPSRYTGHSVAASPWRGGRGNLVREVADAARRHGIKLGVYLSPADLYQLRTNPTNPHGYYGDGSAELRSTIPTDPEAFTSDPLKGRTPVRGTYSYKVDNYNRYFLNQLYELLTEYGPIQEVWFDGANPDASVKETYDYNAWYDLIRHLQPRAIIFGKGPDGRWVGNESGVGRATEWDPVPLPVPPDQFRWPDMRDEDLGSRAKLTTGSYLWWYPAETNVPILHGWFWAPDKAVRSASELIDIFYQSVGRNSNWLLNLSPDERGLIPELQRANLRGMNEVITRTFARNLAAGAKLSATSSAPQHAPSSVLDKSLDTWWEPGARDNATPALTLTLPHPASFDVVSLQEAVDHRGQRIESFRVEVWRDGAWTKVSEGTTVGHKRLLRLAAPVSSDRVRLVITGSRLEPSIAEVGLYKQAALTAAPETSDRGARELSHGWKIVAVDSEQGDQTASKAIDGKPSTLWMSASKPGPHFVTLDLGREQLTRGFSYLPRQDGVNFGLVRTYSLETSGDGQHWVSVIASGEFSNLVNNPELQSVTFAPTRARFVRFTALSTYDESGAAGAAELSVLGSQ